MGTHVARYLQAHARNRAHTLLNRGAVKLKEGANYSTHLVRLKQGDTFSNIAGGASKNKRVGSTHFWDQKTFRNRGSNFGLGNTPYKTIVQWNLVNTNTVNEIPA